MIAVAAVTWSQPQPLVTRFVLMHRGRAGSEICPNAGSPLKTVSAKMPFPCPHNLWRGHSRAAAAVGKAYSSGHPHRHSVRPSVGVDVLARNALRRLLRRVEGPVFKLEKIASA